MFIHFDTENSSSRRAIPSLSSATGLTVIGRDRFGVFPLRGKVLNVRDAAHKQIVVWAPFPDQRLFFEMCYLLV